MLAVDCAGSGIPLVFIHAYPLSKKMWKSYKPIFSPYFQFISIDLPGFGESPLSGDTVTMDEMAGQVLKTLDELNIMDKAVFIGVSMGGYILFRIFRRAPERVRALAFVATRAAADTEEGRLRRMKTIDIIAGSGSSALADKMISSLFSPITLDLNQNLVRQVRSWIEEAPPRAAIAAQRGMAQRADSTYLLNEINVPTLVLAGEDDAVVPVAEMKGMAEKIPWARFETIAQAGHLLALEKPTEFENHFMHFMRRSVL